MSAPQPEEKPFHLQGNFAPVSEQVTATDLPVEGALPPELWMPFHWSDDYPARMGIMPRDGHDADVQWFEIDPCFIFHTLNAFDENDGKTVVLDACRSSEIWRKAGEMTTDSGELTLHRFRFDLTNGKVKEETLDDRMLEFPRVAAARIGQKNRFGFLLDVAKKEDGSPAFQGLVKIDLERGTSQTHKYGQASASAEPVFVPAEGADPNSDEGWVMSYVHDETTDDTWFTVVDASDLGLPPVARVKLPQRVPYGFHGSWLPDLD